MADSHPQDPGKPEQEPADRGGATELLLCDAQLTDGRVVDVRLRGGRIEAVGTAGSLFPSRDRGGRPPAEATRVDLSGHLLLPAPAEPHAHHDTALTAPTNAQPSAAGPPSNDPHEIQRRVTEAALLQLGHGATALRSHVRIGDVVGLHALEAVLRSERALRGLAELSTVAEPRLLTGRAGTEELAMLRDAVKMGASVIGGCPDLDPDPAGYVDAVLEVAAEHGCSVDLHTDGADPARLVRLAAAAGGLRPGVSIGPCGGLARLPHDVTMRVAERLATAGITVVALPQGSCGTLERHVPSRVAPVRLLRAAGVRVTAGSGALRDAANPVGRGDPLNAAYLLASHGESPAVAAYDAVSNQARTAMGLPRVRVEPGFPAELLAVRGTSIAGVLSLAYSRIVVHRGRVVARTTAVREYCDSVGAAGDSAEQRGPAGPGEAEDFGSPTGLGLPRQSQG